MWPSIRALAASNVRGVHATVVPNRIIRGAPPGFGGPICDTSAVVSEDVIMSTLASAAESAVRMGLTTTACHDPRALLNSFAGSAPGTSGSASTQKRMGTGRSGTGAWEAPDEGADGAGLSGRKTLIAAKRMMPRIARPPAAHRASLAYVFAHIRRGPVRPFGRYCASWEHRRRTSW